MKGMKLAGAAIAALMLPAGAQAAEFGTIGCIERAVPPMLGKRFGDATIAEARAQANGGKVEKTELPGVENDVNALAEIAATCQKQYGWSDEALQAAIGYSVARMSVSGARSLLNENGMDAAAVEKAFAALPLHYRTAFVLEKVPDEAVNALIDAIAKRGIAVDTQAKGVYIGIIAGLYASVEVDLDRFVKN